MAILLELNMSNKPRVAIFYDVLASTGFRNDGGPLFANYNLRKILNGCKTFKETKANMSNKDGNVVHLSPVNPMDSIGYFDLNILVDYGEDGLNIPLNWEIKHPNAYWCSDAHITKEGYEYRLNRAKQFDFVFCAQKRAMEEFEKDGIPKNKLFFLPHAVETDVYKPEIIIEKWDWIFIGHANCQERVDLLDRFCLEIPNWYLGWRRGDVPGYNVLDDVSHKFNQSRLILNQNISDDINMRTFEAMATRRCLLTKDIPTLSDLYQPDKHLVAYRTIDEAVEKAKFLLAHNTIRDSIAVAGYQETILKHTYMHRMKELLKVSLNYVPEGAEYACASR